MHNVGIDEVGRGCMAGPVVACAAILPSDFKDDRIIDSKKISEKKRNALFQYLIENCVDYGFGVVCSHVIDTSNILRATKQAMHMALSKLTTDYHHITVDAVKLNNLNVSTSHPYRAEDTHIEVAAASILAKVYRDQLMRKLHLLYPEYNWYKNKGYGTKEHMNAIESHGITHAHRQSFMKGRQFDIR